MHCMKNQVVGDTGYMAIKLDMSKAYDWIEWVYLENIMRKMGFCEQWIGLIMACVQSVTYSILVNREPHGLIHPTGGIRTVLKIGPDQPVRPVQPGIGSQFGPVKTPKIGQQPVKNRAKTRIEPKIKKKTVLCPARFLKTWAFDKETLCLLFSSSFALKV